MLGLFTLRNVSLVAPETSKKMFLHICLCGMLTVEHFLQWLYDKLVYQLNGYSMHACLLILLSWYLTIKYRHFSSFLQPCMQAFLPEISWSKYGTLHGRRQLHFCMTVYFRLPLLVLWARYYASHSHHWLYIENICQAYFLLLDTQKLGNNQVFCIQLVIFIGGPWIGAKMDTLPRVFAFNVLSTIQVLQISRHR